MVCRAHIATMQRSAVQRNAVQRHAVQRGAAQCSTEQHRTDVAVVCCSETVAMCSAMQSELQAPASDNAAL